MSTRICLICGERWVAEGLCHAFYDELRDPEEDDE